MKWMLLVVLTSVNNPPGELVQIPMQTEDLCRQGRATVRERFSIQDYVAQLGLPAPYAVPEDGGVLTACIQISN